MKATIKQIEEIKKMLDNEDMQENGTFITGIMAVLKILNIKI